MAILIPLLLICERLSSAHLGNLFGEVEYDIYKSFVSPSGLPFSFIVAITLSLRIVQNSSS